jgi:hypothetical protein
LGEERHRCKLQDAPLFAKFDPSPRRMVWNIMSKISPEAFNALTDEELPIAAQ